MNKTFITLISCLVYLFPANAQEKGYFNNPVIHGDLADPALIRIGKTYYATATSSEWAPHYPVFTSTDLVNWKQAGHLFTKKPEWTASSFWAPELFYHNNKVFAYYTARRKSDNVSYIGVASADSPTGEYTDHGLLVEFGKEAIDAFILEDNGQLYITWKAYGLDDRPIELLASKLSDDGLHLIGEPFSLLKDDKRVGMEGQHWLKHGEYYYLIYAANGCCGPTSDYAVCVARSKELKGPYEKYEGNPILHGGDAFLSCGHGTMVTTPDNRMYYLCHAYLAGAGFHGGRQPILQEMVFGDDNWIHFTTGDVATIRQPLPFKNTKQQPVKDFEDAFNNKKLNLEWSWNYVYADPRIEIKNGNLQLSGTLQKDYHSGTALCLRPTSSDYTIETQVVNTNKSLKGITMYGDEQNLFIFGAEGDELILKTIIDKKEQILSRTPLTASPVYLRMEVTDGSQCSFSQSTDGKQWTSIDSSQGITDSSKLNRWDRVARPGLIHSGDVNQPGVFSYCNMNAK